MHRTGTRSQSVSTIILSKNFKITHNKLYNEIVEVIYHIVHVININRLSVPVTDKLESKHHNELKIEKFQK